MAEVGDTSGSPDIFSDANFQVLAARATGAEEFARLLTQHLPGYTQKQRLTEGLKELVVKVDTAENKQYLAKQLGKAKSKLEPDEQALVDRYRSSDLREKIQTMNADLQAMIDEGRITFEEKPHVQEQLATRRAKAKAAEKAKLVEKLEKMISSVAKAKPIELPVPDLEEVYPLYTEFKEIQRLEKRQHKSLGAYERVTLSRKPEIEEAIREWSKKSRMWFETEFEFNPRLDRALDALAKQKAEQKKREEEEEFEKKRLADEQALEQKRLALQQAEERRAKELETKLEVKRLEAALKPQKAAPPAKKKDKVIRTKLDPHDFFAPPPRGEGEEDEEGHDGEAQAEDNHEDHPGGQEDEDVSAPPVAPSAEAGAPESSEAPPPPPAAPEKTAAPDATTAAKPKVATESIWQAPAAAAEGQEGLAEDVGPSLADAAKEAPIVKKTPPPQPKKKEKKKFTKIAASELGFD